MRLPNGALIPSPPGVVRWIWDGEFCGRIWLRWSGTGVELPPGWLGHIAYEIVPWKRGRGYAARALGRMLAEARKWVCRTSMWWRESRTSHRSA